MIIPHGTCLYRAEFKQRETPLYVCASSFEQAVRLIDNYLLDHHGLELYSVKFFSTCIL